MNIISLYEIAQNPEKLFTKLQELKLIPTEKECSNCKNQMNVCPRNDYPEQCAWRCRSKYKPSPKAAFKQCDIVRSIRGGTFFGKFGGFGGGSNLSLFQASYIYQTYILKMHMRWKNCFCAAAKGRLGMVFATRWPCFAAVVLASPAATVAKRRPSFRYDMPNFLRSGKNFFPRNFF